MTEAQRRALADMASAVLACSCAPPSMRMRATLLRARLGYGNLGSIFAGTAA